jgi:hypothetical protein
MRLIAILCCFACVGAVTVKVGSTNVVGTTNPSLKQDTFRGEPSLCLIAGCFSHLAV